MHLFVHTKHSKKAGPFSGARLKMDLPFHNRFAYNRVHRRSASPLDPRQWIGRIETSMVHRGTAEGCAEAGGADLKQRAPLSDGGGDARATAGVEHEGLGEAYATRNSKSAHQLIHNT